MHFFAFSTRVIVFSDTLINTILATDNRYEIWVWPWSRTSCFASSDSSWACTIYQPVPSRVKPKLVIWFPECLIVCKWPHSSLEELYAKARSAFPFEWRPACPSSSHFCRQYQIFLNFSSRLSAKEMPRALHVSLDLLLRGHYPPRQGNSMGPIHREPCIFSLTSFSLSNSFTGYIKTWSRIKISCKLAFNLTYEHVQRLSDTVTGGYCDILLFVTI